MPQFERRAAHDQLSTKRRRRAIEHPIGHLVAILTKASFWLRELPYAALFVLAIFVIAYNSYSKQSIVGYREFLALVICLVCIGSGWPHAHGKKARLRLVWTQVLHWLAFLVAMNLVLLPNVQRMMEADAPASPFSRCWR